MPSRTIIAGTVRVPGDKSITHRALMLTALCPGTSFIGGALTSLDARSTARVLRALGAEISPLSPGRVVRVRGRQHFRPPVATLNAGNSGTTARLMLGLLAAHRFTARLTGDASLRRRPMRRVTEPLTAMGARIKASPHDGLPLSITGGKLRPVEYQLSVASAQIKSAILLAAAAANVEVSILQPEPSRDHTERMLRALGFTIKGQGNRLDFFPTGRFAPFDFQVPGDPSSAAFLVGSALLADEGELLIHEVGLNPTRTGFLGILNRMGASIQVTNLAEPFGEPVGTLTVQSARLKAVEVAASEIPAAIDEIPLLACLAARAEGTSRFRGLAELRVKESDRLTLMAENLRAVGVRAWVEGDELLVGGTAAALRGKVITAGDHRIAMAFMVLAGGGTGIQVDDPDCAAVSFPGFRELLAQVRQRT